MLIYLAAVNSKIPSEELFVKMVGKNRKESNVSSLNILESYYYLRKNPHKVKLLSQPNINLLIDSGAFTFLLNSHLQDVDFDKYAEEYARFIVEYNIKNFFELDIDSIVGLKEVERLRDKIEKIVGRKSIPVWHKNRGKDYFIEMCKNYPYVALGGIVSKEIPTRIYESLFPWFIHTAHKFGAKIHGLGYTSIKGLSRYKFDSVDSTSWLYGGRGGFIYQFDANHGIIRQIRNPSGVRLKPKESCLYSFKEWRKFTMYAKQFL